MKNLARCFFETAARQREHPLILGQTADDTTTYGAFADEVRRLAGLLEAKGIGVGSNVGLHHRSGKDYIALVYAVWAAGGCITPLPLELTSTEKGHIFDFIHMDAVISEARLFDQIVARTAHRDADEAVAIGEAAVLAEVDSDGTPPAGLEAVDAAFIRFTSGTTGDAKGVVLSHEAIHTRIHAANRVLEVGPHDRILWLLSMDYHFAVSIVAYLTFGASVILPRNTFGVTLLAAANTHRATFIYGAPIHYALMTQDDTGAELPPTLRLAIVTTTALKATAADAFHARFGRVLNETYGIIELGLPAINISHDRSKQGSVGRVVPGYDLLIECADGEREGEITVRADGMLDAYYAPWRTRDAILDAHGGRFRTGDLGRLDADGYLYIVGRIKEMISVGGLKFFPAEVDTVLEAHPAVRSACVFGDREGQWGSTVSARLVLEDGCEAPDRRALRAWCQSALASYKVPATFEWVDALDYTASGKKIRNLAGRRSNRDEA